jgi:hypothetical protein
MKQEYVNIYGSFVDQEAVQKYGDDIYWMMLDALKDYLYKNNLVLFTKTENGLQMEIHISPPEYWQN